MNRLLLVEDKESLAQMLEEALSVEGFSVDIARTKKEALRFLSRGERYFAIVTDLRLPDGDGIEVLRKSREEDPDCPVVVMTGYGTIESAVDAMKLGAHDFIQKPVDLDLLVLVLRRCQEQRAIRFENLLLRADLRDRYNLPQIVGGSDALQQVSQQVQKVAATNSSVLLLGESGTGKELFARALHTLSPRKDRAFVAVNCAAIPETLLENELFGHERGAYTGASSRQLGRFELADAGTIFLDEIGELGPAVQGKLLRVLENRKFERLGGTTTLEVDVRVVCATNRDLRAAVNAGLFREDLFFRINGFPITVPPLRSRREDIDALADFFAARFSGEMGRSHAGFTSEAREAMRAYSWPGNIRELENCIERAVILSESGEIGVEDLTLTSQRPQEIARIREVIDLSGPLREVTSRAAETAEKARIELEVERHGDIASIARALSIGVKALNQKAAQYGISLPAVDRRRKGPDAPASHESNV